MYRRTTTTATFLLLLIAPALNADPVTQLQAGYREQGVAAFSAGDGEALWNREFRDAGSAEARSCAGCHSADLRQAGKHVRTGKPIDPMAPSVNPERLTDVGKIEKWFRRNCDWTLGRECTPREKGDLLQFISAQ